MGIQIEKVLEVILAGVGLTIITGVMGMLLWYIKVKPDIETIKADLAKKAASVELGRVTTDLEHKKEEATRIKEDLGRKQNVIDCDLLRKGCQPLITQQINGLCVKMDDLRGEQRKLSDKIESWMKKE